MKPNQLLCVVITAILAMPLLASAEIYKWKDKDGVVRYSDTPPPSNIKQEPIGKKKVAKPVDTAPASDTGSAPAAATAKQPAKKEVVDPEVEAARLRQHNAEVEKKNKFENEKQTRIKEENCKVARGNLGNYQQGGRLYKTDENGNRQYITDKELEENKAQAQRDVDENCN